MLIGDCYEGVILSPSYYREITRLAGDFSDQIGLAAKSMQRTLSSLEKFNNIITSQNISQVRAVGTAALRRAGNRQYFIDKCFTATGLKIEVIDGAEEALLTTKGVLSVIEPLPEAAIIIDIGGGSTELVCVFDGHVRLQQSYPLGVVRLCEECSSDCQRQRLIDVVFAQFSEILSQTGLSGRQYQLIGTAGTITTLAALHLQLKNYDASLINNHELSICWLKKLQQKLKLLSVFQREVLIGMEKGRGDLILLGLQILLILAQHFQQSNIKVVDSGLLEGILLNLF
jgi:exopolyphosphatase/guanosine-5'-triphosphate,3'-diphosphate pyrophosphatase